MHVCLEHAVSKSTTQLQQWRASHTAAALVTPLGKHMPQMRMVLTRDNLLKGTLACRSWDLLGLLRSYAYHTARMLRCHTLAAG